MQSALAVFAVLAAALYLALHYRRVWLRRSRDACSGCEHHRAADDPLRRLGVSDGRRAPCEDDPSSKGRANRLPSI